MKQSISYKNIWRVSLPIILSSTAQNVVNAIDTAFLTRLGEAAVGAAGNSILFYYVFVVAAMGFSIGGEILVGRRNGEGEYTLVGKIIDHCIYSFIPLSILLFIILHFLSPFVLSEMVKSTEVLSLSNQFLQMRSFGIFFALANTVFRIFYVGITQTRILTYSTLLMALVNVVLDYLLIFGKFGFPEMGIAGAALASVIAEAATTLYFIYTIRKNNSFGKYDLFIFRTPDRKMLNSLLKIATPTMIQSFIAVSAWLVFFLIIEKIGERALAISHIIRSIYMIMIIPLFGFSAATSTLVSNVIGQGDQAHVLKLVKMSVNLSLMCSMVFFPIVLFFPETILGIYTLNPESISAAKPLLTIVNFAMLLFAVSYILFSAVSGTGNTKISLFIETITIIIYLSIAYYLAVQVNASLTIVWLSEFIYFGIMGPLSLIYLKYGNWKLAKI